MLLPAAVVAGAGLLIWLALPTVWWGPLNVDEELTLRLSDFSFRHIFHIVSTERGGGPLHFWLEHFLLRWWPGLPALRVPSLAFLCLALPAVALIARRLAGRDAGAAVVLLTAVSPIPVLYATFGRPHTLLFAWLMWATVLALRAAADGGRGWWIAAGAALGLTVFVHPTAPLYAFTAYGAALLYAPRPPRVVIREAWPGLVALIVTFLPYYVKTLHVLTDRYGVAAGAHGGRTFDGNPVWEDALHYVGPGPHDINYFTVLAAIGAVALIVRGSWRTLAFCALTVLTPVVFFSVVPASGDSALFFDRYMIPCVPAFLVVVMTGAGTIARWAGRYGFIVLAILAAGLLATELRIDNRHRNAVHGIGLDAVTKVAAQEPPGSVLFGSTGTSGALFSSFDYGHPANILDHYIALRVHALDYVDDDACQRALPFLEGAQTPRYGVWLFYAAGGDEAASASRAFSGLRDVRVREVDGHYFVIRSTSRLAPRPLIRLGQSLRLRWRGGVPLNKRVNELLQSDRQLLSQPLHCAAYGDLGDPDIDPHWPPVKTSHQ